jgi:hypothetical protein
VGGATPAPGPAVAGYTQTPTYGHADPLTDTLKSAKDIGVYWISVSANDVKLTAKVDGVESTKNTTIGIDKVDAGIGGRENKVYLQGINNWAVSLGLPNTPILGIEFLKGESGAPAAGTTSSRSSPISRPPT